MRKGLQMTNELGTTLSDIEAKAERKREAEKALTRLQKRHNYYGGNKDAKTFDRYDYETVRKYIEEN